MSDEFCGLGLETARPRGESRWCRMLLWGDCLTCLYLCKEVCGNTMAVPVLRSRVLEMWGVRETEGFWEGVCEGVRE